MQGSRRRRRRRRASSPPPSYMRTVGERGGGVLLNLCNRRTDGESPRIDRERPNGGRYGYASAPDCRVLGPKRHPRPAPPPTTRPASRPAFRHRAPFSVPEEYTDVNPGNKQRHVGTINSPDKGHSTHSDPQALSSDNLSPSVGLHISKPRTGRVSRFLIGQQTIKYEKGYRSLDDSFPRKD